MVKDKLFLIKPGFTDPNRPGAVFVCPYCNKIEGLLAAFPALAAGIDVARVDFPRPRAEVIALLGEDNQSLPAFVFGDNPPADAREHNGIRFISNTIRIVALLAERHGFPQLH
ncbi:DUF3088 domain-containing protein [Pseudochelatococcus sp. B33]